MAESAGVSRAVPGFVVLREVEQGHWYVVGEVARRPGLSARAARVQAIKDATSGTPDEGGMYAAVLRSEWHIAQQF